MRKMIVCAALCAAALLGLACCDEERTAGPTEKDVVLENTSLALRVDRTNDFAFSLYRHLREEGGNLIISPHSIAVCFGMAYAGARGVTEREIAEVLHFQYPPSNFHSAMKELNELLMSRGTGGGMDAFRLEIANGAWGAEYWRYLDAYCDTLSECYGAPMEFLDFAGAAEAARDTINLWIAERTYGRIDELLPENVIDAYTYLVLANTVYFRAAWLAQFDPDYTRAGYFELLDGTPVGVPIMQGEGTFPYYECEDYCAVSLPYVGGEVSFVAVLPDDGKFEAVESVIDAGFIAAVVDSLANEYITIDLPKYAYSSTYELDEVLEEMGMPSAFDVGANFTGMDGVDDGMPWISLVAHEAFISVDEYGTEAAAATAMILSLGMHNSFDATRPFLYAVIDHGTGTILFLGRVLDPRG